MLIAIHYAINEAKLWGEFEKVGSVDKILSMIANREIE